jgi:hypothetical protein
MTTEIVLNRCYGGFSLSWKAYEYLIKKKGYIETVKTTASFYPDNKFFGIEGDNFDAFRTHPDLIEVVKKLGDASNGEYSSLEVVTIPDNVVENGYYIEDNDGVESVHEYHWIG